MIYVIIRLPDKFTSQDQTTAVYPIISPRLLYQSVSGKVHMKYVLLLMGQ